MPPQESQPETTTPSAADQPVQPTGSPETQPTQSSDPVPTQSPVVGNAPSQRRKKFGWLLVLLLVVAAATAAAYLLLKPAKDNETAAVKHDIAVFNVGVDAGSTELYPASPSGYSVAVSNQVFEGLVQYRSMTKIVPLLARGWTNPDASTWDFELKRNVKFHDGKTMTAKDVAYSMELARTSEDLSGSYGNTLASAKVLDDYKVEIKTTQPDPFFLNKLAYLMILEDGSAERGDASNGTGPYKLKPSTKITPDKIQLAAYDGYHGGHVYIRQLNFIVEPDEQTAAKDLQAGKLNMAGEFLEGRSTQPPASSGLHRIREPGLSVTTLILNSVSPGPLHNKQVREALRYSLDLPKLIKDAGLDAQPASQFMTKAIPGYNQSLPVPKQDIAKAKALLAEAGYPNGAAFTITVDSGSEKVPNLIAQQAKAAGFNITVKTEDDFDKLIEEVISGKLDSGVFGFTSDVLDGSDVFTQMFQETEDYKSSTLDKYLTQAAGTLDETKRLKILQDTSKFLYDDVAAIPLLSRDTIWYTDKSTYNISFETASGIPGVYFWQVYNKQ